MKPESSRRIFEKYSNIKFHYIRPVEAALFSCRHAVGRTWRS